MQTHEEEPITDWTKAKPVPKKECLKMIEKLESEAPTKENRRAVQQMYMETKRYGSESGRR